MAIQCTLLTNQISVQRPSEKVKNEYEYVVSPELSLMLLYVAVRKTVENPLFDCLEGTMVLRSLQNSIDCVLEYLQQQPSDHEIGAMLEAIFREWLSIRVVSALRLQSSGNRQFNAASVMGFQKTASVNQLKKKYPDLNPLFEKMIDLTANSLHVHEMKSNSHGDEDNFLNELENVSIPPDQSQEGLVFIKPCPNRPDRQEAWDLCLKFFFPDVGPIYVFFENKSAKIKSSEAKPAVVSGLSQMANGAKQYIHTKRVLGSRNTTTSYLYVYATTYNVESFSAERAIQLGVRDLRKILGPMYELYAIIRSRI
jgi:hypothetical protein